jgi:hypothetical protein
MLNTKYLNTNNKLKKKVINLFVPMLFGVKTNKMIKTLYYEKMYYKVFYLLFNHISLIDVFFKDKKIFYNFSKYFQTNLYIYLIKTNLIILDLFFHFFYMLFLTFENFEDVYNNNIFLRGYKRRVKHKTFFKKWVKPDHGIKFYFNQRINSISLYVLNYNIYKNIYFSKYNLFLIHTKLIYKLFHYFKMLQYKLQSFIILYKKHFKLEKKIRLWFAKSNCMIYKHLNFKLIKYFSCYKLYLKKKNILNEDHLFELKKMIELKKKNINLTKKIIKKPIYNKIIKNQVLKKENEKKLIDLTFFTDIFLAKRIFKFIFGTTLIPLYSHLFYNNICKLKWLKIQFLNNKVYYKNIFVNFFIKFSNYYLISIKRHNVITCTSEEFKKSLLGKFLIKFKKVLTLFISNFFFLNNLTEKIKINFINFVMEKLKFNFLLKAISFFEFTKISEFHAHLIKLFEQFLNNEFDINKFHINLTYKQKERQLYLFKKKFSVAYTHIMYDFPLKYLAWRRFIYIVYMKRYNVLKKLMRNRFSKINFSILDLPMIGSYYNLDYSDDSPTERFALLVGSNTSDYYYNQLKLKSKKKGFKFKLFSFFQKRKNDKEKKKNILNLLSKKLKKKKKIKKIKIKKKKIRQLILLFFKEKRINFLLNTHIKKCNSLLKNKILFLKKQIKNRITYKKLKLKKKIINLKKLKLKQLKLKKKFKKKKLKIKKPVVVTVKKSKNKKKINRKKKKFTNFQYFKYRFFKPYERKKIKRNSFFRYYSNKIDRLKKYRNRNNFKKFNNRNNFKKFKNNNLKKYHHNNNKFKKYRNKKFKFKKFGKIRHTKKIKRKIKKILRFLRKNKITSYFFNTKIHIRKKHRLNSIFYNNLKLKKKLFKFKNFKNFILREKFYHIFFLKKRFKTKCFKYSKTKFYKNRFFKIYNKFKYKKLKKLKLSKKIKRKKLKLKKKLIVKKDLSKLNNFDKSFFSELRFVKKKLSKFKKFKIFKIKKKLIKLNRKKILYNTIKFNYLFQIKKYIVLRLNKIKEIEFMIFKLLQFRNKLIDTSKIYIIDQKISKLKEKLSFFNKKKLKKSFNMYFDIDYEKKNRIKSKNLIKLNLTKKNGFKKKPFFLKYNLKNNFFKKKLFTLNRKSLDKKKAFFYSKNFKRSTIGKKFKIFLKSTFFKKLINFKKHYKKYLQIKKRIRKEIKFRLNYYLILKGYKKFIKLNKRKKKNKYLILKNKKKIKFKKKSKNHKIKKKVRKYKIKKILINLKIFQILNQNDKLNNLIQKSNNFNLDNLINLKNNNNNKLFKLYSLKVKSIKKIIKLNMFSFILKKMIKIKKKTIILNQLIKINQLKYKKLLNKKTLLTKKKLKLKQIKIKKLKIKIKKLKINFKKLKINFKKLKNLKKKKLKNFISIKDNIVGNYLKKTELKKLELNDKLEQEKIAKQELKEMQHILFLKKKDEDSVYNIKLSKNATTFDYGMSAKERKKRHINRVQRFYKRQYERIKKEQKTRRRIPRTKKKIYFFVKSKKYAVYRRGGKLLKKKKKFNFKKYMFFFKILLKTRLKLFNDLSNFKVLFLTKLKNLIKNILFKNKINYYNLVKHSFNGMSFYNEYKLWHLQFKKLKKIPFKLIRLYSKFYFNKLLYNLKFKSNFSKICYNYLNARAKVKYFNVKSKKSFKKKKVRKLFKSMLYKLFKSSMNFFMTARKVIFSLIRNGSFFMYYKVHQVYGNISKQYNNYKKSAIVSLFLKNLKMKRSFYVSKYTKYSNFFFIYWAKRFYGYNVYGNAQSSLDKFVILNNYFKFFKSKTFFFNYLINFIFSYIQKLNINIFNYVFILNQYKTKLIIELNQFYKYLILFFFKKNQYLNFLNLKKEFNLTMPKYFSFFSIYFKQLSLELSNWYSFVNNNNVGLYQPTLLFNLCFISNNTNAIYLHYKYKYLYYYRVYNFYIFYIFYYLYNHLFKVYKKLKLKDFKLSYDLIKYNEYNRYYLGLRTRMLILTIRNKYKHGFPIERIFRNIKFFLRESMKKKELAGYYISIRGRYKRSSRSNKLIIKKGVYSFNKIDLKIDSSYGTLNTRYGIAGIKVIFAFK